MPSEALNAAGGAIGQAAPAVRILSLRRFRSSERETVMASPRRIRRIDRASLIISVLVSVGACDRSSAPQIPFSPTPTLEATEYRVSGVVTNEDGTPAANASLGVAFDPGANPLHTTTADGAGNYEIRFSRLPPPPSVIQAYRDGAYNTQALEWAARDSTVKNLRLRRPRLITAGESFVIPLEPDSSLCNWEFGSSMTTLCEWFGVTARTAGLLTIEARPTDPAGILPLVGWENRGQAATLSFQVSANPTAHYVINLAIPVAAAPQRYEVRTSVQP